MSKRIYLMQFELIVLAAAVGFFCQLIMFKNRSNSWIDAVGTFEKNQSGNQSPVRMTFSNNSLNCWLEISA